MSHEDEMYDDKIANLQAELKSYGKDIVELLNGVYGGKSSPTKNISFDLKNNPFKMVEFLKTELIELIQECHENDQIYQRYQTDLNHCQRLVDILSSIGRIVEDMNKFDASLNQFQLVTAAELVIQVENAVSDIPKQLRAANIPTGAQIFKLLKNERNVQKSRFKSLLRRILAECIRPDVGSVRVLKKISDYLKCEDKMLDSPIILKDVYAAAVISGNIQDLLNNLIQDLWALVFVPLWREKKQYSPSKNVQGDYSEFLLASVVSGLDQSDIEIDGTTLGNSKLPIPELFDHVGKFLDFVWSDFLLGDSELGLITAEIFRDEPYNLLTALSDTINQRLPKNESDLAAFKRGIEDSCRVLDSKLSQTLRVTSSGSLTTIPTLTETLDNLSTIFSTLRRKEILKTARELVLSDYHNAMIGSGDALDDDLASAGHIGDPKAILDQSAMQKLKFDSCQISLAACRLLKFVHDIMKQATTTSSPSIANLLFHSARDCLEIFIAIIPIKFEEIINNTPRMGAVFYNDCLYIAHNTILLTHQYRLETENKVSGVSVEESGALQGNIGFIDFIPRLRKLGDICMKNHLQQQQALLQEMVKRIGIAPDRKTKSTGKSSGKLLGSGLLADRFKKKFLSGSQAIANIENMDNEGVSTTTVEDMVEEDCFNDENRASMLVEQLEKLSTQWLGVLQEVNYARFMGYLIDGILKELMAPILSAECITETAASEIYRVFKIVQRVKILLPTEDTTVEQQWRGTCPSWDKFLALTDLLEFNLNDIADGLSRKKFVSFTGQEMIHLIKALFEDSVRRQSLISSITEISA